MIHRDLKPGNILVESTAATAPRPRILDFGLAKAEEDGTSPGERSISLTGRFMGSLPWASPEQVNGGSDSIDVRTDVYSIGVMLYQATTGRFPYPVDGNLQEVADAILRVEPA